MRRTWHGLLIFLLAGLALFGVDKLFASRSFTSTANYLSASSTSYNVTGTTLTLAAWVKFISSVPSAQAGIIQKNYSNLFQYALNVSYPTASKFGFQDGNGTTSRASLACSTALSVGTWYQVTATLNGTTMNIYLNGANCGTSSSGISIGSNGANLLCIGVGQSSSTACGTGSPSAAMAEVAIWNVALTANEIKALANCTPPPVVHGGSSLVGYWPLWGGDSPEQDYSGGKSSATVTGATPANHVCGGTWSDK